MSESSTQPIHTRIWLEEPEADNPFAARAAYCRGYDVFGELVGRARWVDMLWLLFREEAPLAAEADRLEALAVALANPGPRDPSVHAAMCGGVCGSTAASSLIGALATGAGQHTGAREVFRAMQAWESCGLEREDWARWMAEQGQPPARISTWPETRHVPGFDPNGASTPGVVRQLLDRLLALEGAGSKLRWLAEQLPWLESVAGGPLAISGVAAAALSDLGFNAEQGEMLYLLLRLPGAAAHALEQGRYGHKRFPFYELELLNDPGPRGPAKAETAR